MGRTPRYALRLAAAGLATVALVATSPAAFGQNLFEMLFGGFFRPPPPVRSYAPDLPDVSIERGRRDGRGEWFGARQVFCVRLCDGMYFPLGGGGPASAAQCQAFCPAAATKVFAGGTIERAIARDGTRYEDLPNAFVYRERLDPACSCTGAGPAGMARMPIADDPTLLPGDLVATDAGLVAFAGRTMRGEAAFTPIERPVPRTGLAHANRR